MLVVLRLQQIIHRQQLHHQAVQFHPQIGPLQEEHQILVLD